MFTNIFGRNKNFNLKSKVFFFNDDSAQFLMIVLIQCGRRKKISGLFIAYLPQSQIKYFLRNILCVFIEKIKKLLYVYEISHNTETVRKQLEKLNI